MARIRVTCFLTCLSKAARSLLQEVIRKRRGISHLDKNLKQTWRVLQKDVVGLCLGGIVCVGVGKQFLNAQHRLLDAERGAPVFLFVQNRQTDRARGKDVRVEERRHKAAPSGTPPRRTFAAWRGRLPRWSEWRVIRWDDDDQMIKWTRSGKVRGKDRFAKTVERKSTLHLRSPCREWHSPRWAGWRCRPHCVQDGQRSPKWGVKSKITLVLVHR